MPLTNLVEHLGMFHMEPMNRKNSVAVHMQEEAPHRILLMVEHSMGVGWLVGSWMLNLNKS